MCFYGLLKIMFILARYIFKVIIDFKQSVSDRHSTSLCLFNIFSELDSFVIIFFPFYFRERTQVNI